MLTHDLFSDDRKLSLAWYRQAKAKCAEPLIILFLVLVLFQYPRFGCKGTRGLVIACIVLSFRSYLDNGAGTELACGVLILVS